MWEKTFVSQPIYHFDVVQLLFVPHEHFGKKTTLSVKEMFIRRAIDKLHSHPNLITRKIHSNTARRGTAWSRVLTGRLLESGSSNELNNNTKRPSITTGHARNDSKEMKQPYELVEYCWFEQWKQGGQATLLRDKRSGAFKPNENLQGDFEMKQKESMSTNVEPMKWHSRWKYMTGYLYVRGRRNQK